MRSIESLGRRSLIVDCGKRGGELGGKMVGVIELYVYGVFVGVVFSLLFGLDLPCTLDMHIWQIKTDCFYHY